MMIKHIHKSFLGAATFLAASFLMTASIGSAQTQTLISNAFDGSAGTGPAFQKVDNGQGGGGGFTPNTGVIQTSGAYNSAVGANSNTLVNVTATGATSFTIKWVVSGASNIASYRLNGLFFGVTDNAGTGGGALFNNADNAIGLTLLSESHEEMGLYEGVNGTRVRTDLGVDTPTFASFEDGFTVSLTFNSDQTWSATTTGLSENINHSGTATVDYATLAGGLAANTSIQGPNISYTLDSVTLTTGGTAVNLPMDIHFGDVRYLDVLSGTTRISSELAPVSEGDTFYTDDDHTILSLPAELDGKLALKTQNHLDEQEGLIFSGSNAEVVLPDGLGSGVDFSQVTGEAWVFLNGEGHRGILQGDGFLHWELRGGNWRVRIGDFDQDGLPGNVPNTWVHLAFTYDQDTGEFFYYVNGEEVFSTIDMSETAGSLFTGGEGLNRIGTSLDTRRFWQGTLRDFRIWNVIRGEAEIAASMGETLNPGEHPDLVAYWPMNEGEGSVVNDLAGGHHGEIVGAEWGIIAGNLPEADPVNYLGFLVDRPTTVYVAYDEEAEVPTWLSNRYSLTGMTVETTAGTFDLWARSLEAREQVSLLFDRTAWSSADQSYWVILSEGPDAITLRPDGDFRREPLEDWNLMSHNWRVVHSAESEQDTAAMGTEIADFDPDRGFKMATTLRVPRLQDEGDNAFGFSLLGESGEGAIRAEWLPREAGGGSTLRIVDSSSGDVLNGISWTGLSPTAVDNNVGLADPSTETVFSVGSSLRAIGVPFFSEDFEDGGSGWEMGSNSGTPTQWEIGEPESGPQSAFSGNNVAGTVLSGGYSASSNSFLRSPEIDLTEKSGMTLAFREYMDVDTNSVDGTLFHFGTVSVVDVDTGETTELIRYSEDILDWQERELDLSAFAGMRIRIEFGFRSDNVMNAAGDGWYIDDVRVIGGAVDPIVSMPEALTLDGNLNGLITVEDEYTDESDSYLEFTVSDRGTGNAGVAVYVAWDSRASGLEPDWLRDDFARTDHAVGVDGGADSYRLWSRVYADGETVTLGGASAAGSGPFPSEMTNYFVLFGDARPGLETLYHLTAEGVRSGDGWSIDFSLSDADGHTQTVTATIEDSRAGATEFGLFARYPDAAAGTASHAPMWDIFDLAIDYVEGLSLADFEAWRAENFEGQLDNPEVSGPDASPAGDGVKNLMKYALGLNPWVAVSSAQLPFLDPEKELALVYWQRTDIQDIEYIPEVSEDLINWQSGEPHVLETSGEPIGDNLIEMEAQGILSDEATRGFIRLKVRQKE